MKIFFLIFIIIITTFIVVKKIFNSAKTNLLKDQAAWSGKDIKIRYSRSGGVKDSQGDENYLKMIADESRIYLNDQSNEEKD